MKHILFILTNFRLGGTNKSLENLLSLIDTDAYQVDVFAMDHYGPYKEMLPNCTILPEDKWLSALIAHFDDTKGRAKLRSLAVKLCRDIAGFLNIQLASYLYKRAIYRLGESKTYDSIIAYSEGVPTQFVSYFHNKNKIAWIHCDYSSYIRMNHFPDETELYRSYRSIVCVSEYTRKEFCKIMPEYVQNTYSLHNMLNVGVVQKKAVEIHLDKKFTKGGYTIITIGTFSPIKRLPAIPDIARQLQERGCYFKWFVIAIKDSIEEYHAFYNKINAYNLSEYVILLGEKDNPYNYLENSDLFVSLSVSEACPYVINESKALHVPIVCTDFPSAPEFVEDGKVGYIAPIEDIVDKIELLIKDRSEYQRIKSNILEQSYDNIQLMNKFHLIVDKLND